MATKKNTAITHGDKEYNYYRITRTVGHEWKNGKKVPIKKQFVGTSKGNAEQKYKAFLEKQAAKALEAEAKIQAEKLKTFGEYAEEYTYEVLPTLDYAKGTKSQYEQKYRTHIRKSFLMTMPISEATAKTIQGYYDSLSVSISVLSDIHKWMSAFYKWLTLNGYAVNILSAVTIPKKKAVSNDIIVWEPEEIEAIFKASHDFIYQFMIYLMYYAGLRISECLGLKYADVDVGEMVCINRQYYRGDICPPKHESYRKIPAHPEVLEKMQIHKQRQRIKSEYIFVSNTGRLLDYHNVRASFKRFYNKNNLPYKKLHAYRATFCTELCRAGVPLEVASKLMGHKSIEVTARHYALVKQDVQIDAINRLPSF